MISRILTLVLLVGTLAGLAGCAQRGPADTPFIKANYQAGDALLRQLQLRLPEGGTLLMATLVNIDALDRSSTFGRLASEQVSARFTQNGYQMIEMKFRNSVYILQNQGELMLTRELHDLAREHAADAVIVGSYGEAKDRIYVNLKVIQPETNIVQAVYDYALPIDEDMRILMRTKR